MRRRTKLIVGLAVLALAAATAPVVLGGNGAAQASRAGYTGKVQNLVLSDTASGQQASFVIQLKAQADLSRAYGMKNQDARGRYVYKTLKAEAAQHAGAAEGDCSTARGVTYHSFWVANLIFVEQGDRALVQDLACPARRRQDRGQRRLVLARQTAAPPALNAFTALQPPAKHSPSTIEYGVNMVHAPDLWALGYTGQGMVIGNQDTGMRWTHNALKPHYRGWDGATADHNYNWHDSIHSDDRRQRHEPVRLRLAGAVRRRHSHGTHTTGTTSGDDGAGNQIGVAPGAKWIGLPQHGPGRRAARRPTRSASSSSSPRPT